MNAKYNSIELKSKALAIRIVRLAQFLQEEKHESTLSQQLLKSGTSVGASVKEATREASKDAFVDRINSALDDLSHIEYLLEILNATGYISDNAFGNIYDENKEVEEQLMGILRVTRNKAFAAASA